MLRPRGQVGLIAVTVIVTVLVTVAVTYAVQSILATREIAASARIVASGANLAVCQDANTNCTVVFPGPVNYGDMSTAVTGDYVVRIRNATAPPSTGEAPASDVFFVDARLRYDGQNIKFHIVDHSYNTVREWFGTNPPNTGGDVFRITFLRAQVPDLGIFSIREVGATGDFNVLEHHLNVSTALQPGEVRRASLSFYPQSDLAAQTLNFDFLIDAVDVVE